jgi:hypothetical protein
MLQYFFFIFFCVVVLVDQFIKPATYDRPLKITLRDCHCKAYIRAPKRMSFCDLDVISFQAFHIFMLDLLRFAKVCMFYILASLKALKFSYSSVSFSASGIQIARIRFNNLVPFSMASSLEISSLKCFLQSI